MRQLNLLELPPSSVLTRCFILLPVPTLPDQFEEIQSVVVDGLIVPGSYVKDDDGLGTGMVLKRIKLLGYPTGTVLPDPPLVNLVSEKILDRQLELKPGQMLGIQGAPLVYT